MTEILCGLYIVGALFTYGLIIRYDQDSTEQGFEKGLLIAFTVILFPIFWGYCIACNMIEKDANREAR